MLLILTKGCTPKEDHEARVTQHRKGPGLSVVSYTRVCRHQNFCNDLTTSLPVWSLPTSAGVDKEGRRRRGTQRGCSFRTPPSHQPGHTPQDCLHWHSLFQQS